MRNKEPHLTAALEAYEEERAWSASLRHARWAASSHRKRKGDRKRTMDVAVFPMKVHGQEHWWPGERGGRDLGLSGSGRASRAQRGAAAADCSGFAAQTEKSASLLLSGKRASGPR